MNKLGMVAVAAVAALAATLVGTALAASAARPVPFSATFNGKAVVIMGEESASISSVQGTGKALPLGKASLTGKGSATREDPCPLFGGRATMSSAGGKVNFTVPASGGSACTDEGGQDFSLSGRATFAGGTGKYKKAKGTFRFSGSYNRGTGLFSVKFRGTITL